MIKYLKNTSAYTNSVPGVVTNVSQTTSAFTISNFAVSVDPLTGALVVYGGTGIGGNLNVAGNTTLGNLTTGFGNFSRDLTVAGTLYTQRIVNFGQITSSDVNTVSFFSSSLTTNQGMVSNLVVSSSANITNLRSNISSITTLTAGSVAVGTITATNLNANEATFNTIRPKNGTTVDIGSIGNVRITGGTQDQVLTTDGNGNLTWSDGPANLGYGSGLIKVGNVVRLATTGVAAGVYDKVTVDIYGRVLVGVVVASDTLDSVSQRSATTSAKIVLADTTDSGAINEGALVVYGGVGIAKTLTATDIVSSNSITSNNELIAQSTLSVYGTLSLNGSVNQTAPMVISPGSLLQGLLIGSIEFDGDGLYITTNNGRQAVQTVQPNSPVTVSFIVRAVASGTTVIGAPTQLVNNIEAWDDVTLNIGDKVLLPHQTTPSENGIYIWHGEGTALTRSPNFNTTTGIYSGSLIVVAEGTQNATTVWQVTTPNPISVNQTNLTISIVTSIDNTSLASLPVDQSSGLVTRTKYGNITLRSVVSTSSWLTVTNGSGKLGNITIGSGVIPVTSGGLGRSSVQGYLRGTGTTILSANTIPVTDISGIGTIATQNANNISVIGGNITALTSITANTGTIVGNLTVSNLTVTRNITVLGNFFSDRGTDPSNWDSNLSLGMYYVNRTSWSATTGTPVDASTFRGLLTILASEDMVVQKYQPNDTTSQYGSEWVRVKAPAGPWTSWSRVVGDTGVVEGGSY